MAEKSHRKKRKIAALMDEMISSEKCLLENEFDTSEGIKKAECPDSPGNLSLFSWVLIADLFH